MYDIFIMDLGGHDDNVQGLVERFPHAKVVRYYDNHLDTVKRCISRCRTPYAWIISSCCSYDDFNFNYKSAPWENYQIHCWASGKQEFGDTFLVPRLEFIKQQDIELLEWYKDVNWHEDGVPRLPWPVVECPTENITEHLKDAHFNAPYLSINQTVDFDPPLWHKRAYYTFNKSGSIAVAPREIQSHLESQIYDYPYVIKQKPAIMTSQMLDIIYISNGEIDSEKWFEHLLTNTDHDVKRVKNVTGRDLAIKQAAKLSTTPWFFVVWGKLEVDKDFDWEWQPDYLQQPKHYIFHARNPVNDLVYGHMAVVAYNKQLVLDTEQYGLDFTMSKLHTVVPLISGTAHYNSDQLMTWRTAFREVIKLKLDTDNIESIHRLQTWLTRAHGLNAEYSTKGAEDGVQYYNKCIQNGERHPVHDALMKSFDWDWLEKHFNLVTP